MSGAGSPELPLAPAPVAAAPAVAPVEAAPSPSPAAATEPAAPVVTPPAEAAAPVAPVVETKAPEAPSSLLADEAAPEAPKAEEPKPAEAKPVPTYEKFSLPEGIQLEEKALGEFTKHLGEFELDAGSDHTKVSALGQKLVDFYVAEQKRTVEAQHEQWRATNEQWQEAFRADPEIGGNRRETTLKTAKSMITQFGGNAEQQKELKTALGMTGAGNHPAVIRLLNNIGKALGEGRPVPAIVPKSPVPDRKSTRRYNGALINGAA